MYSEAQLQALHQLSDAELFLLDNYARTVEADPQATPTSGELEVMHKLILAFYTHTE